MTWPEKIPAQAGFQPRIFRSGGGRLNHYANAQEKKQERRDTPDWTDLSQGSLKNR